MKFKISQSELDKIISEEVTKHRAEKKLSNLQKELDVLAEQMRELYKEDGLDEEIVEKLGLEEIFGMFKKNLEDPAVLEKEWQKLKSEFPAAVRSAYAKYDLDLNDEKAIALKKYVIQNPNEKYYTYDEDKKAWYNPQLDKSGGFLKGLTVGR